MKLALLGLFAFVAVFSGAMSQALPHYNGMVIIRDEASPFIAKISARINTAAITPEQREKEATEILRQSQDSFRQCEQLFGGNPTMIGSLKGCLGRFTGIAMSQISVLESVNRGNNGNNGANNDPSLILRNSNLRNSNLRNSNIRLQNTNLNAQHTNKLEESNESNDNLNRRNSNSRSQNRNTNEHRQSIESAELLNLRNTESRSIHNKDNTQRPSERINSRNNNKHINKQSNESRENRNNRNSNESH